MADRRPVETLVERDDGVVFAMRGAGGGADLPHAAERSTRLKRERAGQVQRAEALADLVSRLSRGADVLPGVLALGGPGPQPT
jgi:hypothetical protein